MWRQTRGTSLEASSCQANITWTDPESQTDRQTDRRTDRDFYTKVLLVVKISVNDVPSSTDELSQLFANCLGTGKIEHVGVCFVFAECHTKEGKKSCNFY